MATRIVQLPEALFFRNSVILIAPLSKFALLTRGFFYWYTWAQPLHSGVTLRVSTQQPWARLFLLIVLFVPVSAHAVLGAILGEKLPFDVAIPEHKRLAERAKEALATQREESPEFDRLDEQRAAARFDRDILQRWLRSQGYFDAGIDAEFTDKKIIYRVSLGERYLIKSITLKLPQGVDAPPLELLEVREGRPLKAEDVLSATSTLAQHVRNNNCLFEVETDYDAEINRRNANAFLTLSVKPSPSVRFAEPQVTGLEDVERDFLAYRLTFAQGDCFRRREIELSRLALLQTNLFARVDVEIEQPTDGTVNVVYDVTERNHRTIKAGVGYDTTTGPGLNLGWEHRNLANRGQRLSVDGLLSEQEKSVLAELAVPHFLRQEQTLIIRTDVKRETTESYEATSAEIGADLERRLYRNLSGSIGTALEYNRVLNLSEPGADIDQGELPSERRRNSTLLSFPLNLDYLDTNDPLNPTRGWGVGFITRPFVDLQNNNARFLKTTVAATSYLTARDVRTTPTLALRLATGTISGATKDEVPINHRFFVGGGGSVRGYAYQSVGDLVTPPEPAEGEDPPQMNAPDGGMAFSEVSLELRFRFSPSWGAVLFADGGYAYDSQQPRFGDDFLWGAGVGMRYFTSFAPIRFDVATPIDRGSQGRYATTANRQSYDDAVQLYISIGQAF